MISNTKYPVSKAICLLLTLKLKWKRRPTNEYYILLHRALLSLEIKRDHKMSEPIDNKNIHAQCTYTSNIQHSKKKQMQMKLRKKEKICSQSRFFQSKTKHSTIYINFLHFEIVFVALLTVLTIYFMMLHRLWCTYLPNTKLAISDQMWSGVECFGVCVCSHII